MSPTAPRRQKRQSSTVPLALVGTLAATAALSGCGDNANSTTIRDGYASMDDCVKDWGSTSKCQQAPGSNGTNGSSGVHSYSGGRFYGPSYAEGSRTSTQKSATGQSGSDHAVGHSVTSFSNGGGISRGGFGGTAHGESGGG